MVSECGETKALVLEAPHEGGPACVDGREKRLEESYGEGEEGVEVGFRRG